MSVHGIARRASVNGPATPTTAPVYVRSSDNQLVIIPAGLGSAEVPVVQGVSSVVSVTASTTIAPASHAGKTIVVNAAAGLTLTLPAATGSGAKYRIVIGTLITSNSFVLAVANGSDYFKGVATVKADDAASTLIGWSTADSGTVATESDTLTWNRTTTGTCIVGDSVEVEDIATNVWAIRTLNKASGSEATPFSAAV